MTQRILLKHIQQQEELKKNIKLIIIIKNI
jgi:hypothetical protein